MRPSAWLILFSALSVCGCHPAPPKPPAATSLIQVSDELIKLLPPAPEKHMAFDVRKAEDQQLLKSELTAYGPALAESDTVLSLGPPSEPFMSEAQIASESKDTGKRLVALKRFVFALTARARLEFAMGEDAKGLKDFSAAAHTCQQLGAKEGAILPYLIDIACVEIFLTEVQGSASDDTLDGKQLLQLAALVKMFEQKPLMLPLLKAEAAAPDKTRTEKDVAHLRNLMKICADEESNPLGTLARLRQLSGPEPRDMTAEGLKGQSAYQLMELAYKFGLRQVTRARMTLGYLNALAEKSNHGKFPSSLPFSGLEAKDPLGNGLLTYQRTPAGFSISSPGGVRLFSNVDSVTMLTLSYPPLKPHSAILW